MNQTTSGFGQGAEVLDVWQSLVAYAHSEDMLGFQLINISELFDRTNDASECPRSGLLLYMGSGGLYGIKLVGAQPYSWPDQSPPSQDRVLFDASCLVHRAKSSLISLVSRNCAKYTSFSASKMVDCDVQLLEICLESIFSAKFHEMQGQMNAPLFFEEEDGIKGGNVALKQELDMRCTQSHRVYHCLFYLPVYASGLSPLLILSIYPTRVGELSDLGMCAGIRFRDVKGIYWDLMFKPTSFGCENNLSYETTPYPTRETAENTWTVSIAGGVLDPDHPVFSTINSQPSEMTYEDVLYVEELMRSPRACLSTTDLEQLGGIENIEVNSHLANDTCAICTTYYAGDDVCRKLDCGHQFHKACIDSWLSRYKKICPMCRKVVMRGRRRV